MSGLNRSFNLLRVAMKHQITPKANITAKPAKHPLSTGEQIFGLTTLFLAILGPSSYILANLESYKGNSGGAKE